MYWQFRLTNSCAMKNVPEWARNQGYNVEIEEVDDGEWEIVIEKTKQKGAGGILKAFWDKLSSNPYYKQIFKNPFTYVTGAVLLSILQIALFASSGSPWGVSGIFANWGAGCTVWQEAMWINGTTSPLKAHRPH